MNISQLAFAVGAVTVLILLIIGAVVLLLVVNSKRVLRHQAELAEAQRRRIAEVQHAEREAVLHTLDDLGRELHDNVGQLLTLALLGLNMGLSEQGERRHLAGAREALDQAIAEARRMAHSLTGDLWRQRSLAEAIAREAGRLERVVRIKASVEQHGDPPALDADTSIMLYRIFQEAVHNTLKHSGADAIRITLDAGPPFRLVIADNGRGFAAPASGSGAGLGNITRRSALVGFEAQCISAPGQGCTWTLTQRPTHDDDRRLGG
jgi:signal transduction histidine kinase